MKQTETGVLNGGMCDSLIANCAGYYVCKQMDAMWNGTRTKNRNKLSPRKRMGSWVKVAGLYLRTRPQKTGGGDERDQHSDHDRVYLGT